MEQNLDEINWDRLSENPKAIHLLEQNPDEINWDKLSLNPNAIHLLEQNVDKINWVNLAQNENAIPLIEKSFNINLLKQNLFTDKNRTALSIKLKLHDPVGIIFWGVLCW